MIILIIDSEQANAIGVKINNDYGNVQNEISKKYAHLFLPNVEPMANLSSKFNYINTFKLFD